MHLSFSVTSLHTFSKRRVGDGALEITLFFPFKAGTWVNGRWITINPDSKRETALNLLDEMGFKNRDYNASLLNRYDDDVEKVLSDLLTIK